MMASSNDPASLPPIRYEPAAPDSNERCYMHAPPHRADWVQEGWGARQRKRAGGHPLALCDKAFRVAEAAGVAVDVSVVGDDTA